MNLSSFFQGSVLRLGVSGEGVGVDPETGELSLPAAALADGLTVTVTARDAAGAEQSFRLRLAAEPAASAPVLLTPPALEGSGRIGTPLVVRPGDWGGEPAPAIALQWLADGAAIEGATAAAYLPQPADDGRSVTCRVTASNPAGVLAAEPAPVVATREPPVVVDLLADVTLSEGEAAATVEAAAAFAGEGLSFAVAGAGATIDPATGRLTLPADAARAGEVVTVTASNSGGAASASFLVTVEAKPLPVPPLLLAVPALAGAGKIGSPVELDPGLWGGLPQPGLAVQWLRDGAEIEGATTASYVPGPADDRAALAARVTATNGAGSLAAETAAITVTYVAPALVGELFDEVFDQGVGDETVATAQVFAGEALGFAAQGLGVTIDPETGVLTISTEAALSGETVTVTASNSGGSAAASFLLTVEAEALPEFPPMLADGAWTAAEVRDAAPAGRRRVEVPAAAAAEGFEICLYSGAAGGIGNTGWRQPMQPGATYVTSSSMKVGSTCHNLLFWRRVADGAWAPASNPVVFEIKGLAPATEPEPEQPATPGFPAASQTLAAATQDALNAALDARVAAGSAGDWIIDLPSGFYGNLNLNARKLPGRTILRSQDKNLGAKFSHIDFSGARNVTFQFVDIDRTLGASQAVKMFAPKDVGIEYSRIHAGGVRTNPDGLGWLYNALYLIDIRSVEGDKAERVRIHMNRIGGPCDNQIFAIGMWDSEITDNVFENAGGDCIHLGGWNGRCNVSRNWSARAYYPKYTPDGGWHHNDFIQVSSINALSPDYVFHGNVQMVGPEGAQNLPFQSLFSSKTRGSGWDYEGNIVCSNSVHGLSCGPAETFSNTRARKNTVLRCIDAGGNQNAVQIMLAGAVERNWNVQCGLSGSKSMGANGLNIPMSAGDYDASLAYYTAPYLASSFFDLRPVEGQPTHWAYADGQPLGAYERFRDVILHGAYPKVGPAAAAWKAWYDPRNQITS